MGEFYVWVEWFCGEWCGFDFINLIDIGECYVLVGCGCDYNDVVLLCGVYVGLYVSKFFVKVSIMCEV